MGDVIVASTTDDQVAVNAAAGGVAQDEEQVELKPPPTGDAQVESAEPEEQEQPEAKTAEEKPKVPRGVDKRIDKLTREKNELATRLAAIEAKQNGAEPEPEKRPQVPTEVAAKFDTFDGWSEKQLANGKAATLEDFLEARDAWKEARDAQKAERDAQAEYQAEIAQAYDARIEEFKTEHPDWEEVVSAADISIPPGVGPAIQEMDNGPSVVYYLATHPKECKELNELSPFRAVAEIGRLAARLEKTQEETPTNNMSVRAPDRIPIVSKAPPPIRPLSGNALRSQSRDYSNMSQDEYNKLRDAEEKAARRR